MAKLPHGGMQVKQRVPLAGLPRLAQVLAEPGGELAVELKLQVAGAGGPRLQASLSASLALRCSRCLQTFHWPLALQLDLRLVADADEERRWLAQDEPYLAAAGVLDMPRLIEDEVLLALPSVAHCRRDECLRRWQGVSY
ncbi:MAG: DUF177 domain-containing protein [Gammaproteobacteria bacterium]|nr:DUF177 domain-containing protein [Gammaproteobacteria bacterium]